MNYILPIAVSLSIVIWFWAMIDLVTSRRKFKDPAKSTLALLMILFFPVVGSLFYFQLKRKLVNRRKRKFNPEFNPH